MKTLMSQSTKVQFYINNIVLSSSTCFLNVSHVTLECFLNVSNVTPECFLNVSHVTPECFLCVSWMCFSNVSVCFLNFSWICLFPECFLNIAVCFLDFCVFWMFPECFLCFLNVSVFPECFLNISVCFLNVSVCFLNVTVLASCSPESISVRNSSFRLDSRLMMSLMTVSSIWMSQSQSRWAQTFYPVCLYSNIFNTQLLWVRGF